MEQQPQRIVPDVYHNAGIEVSKVVALESGETAEGERVEAGQVSVVLVLHSSPSAQEKFTVRFAWPPEVARRLGELLIQQAELIDNDLPETGPGGEPNP